MAASMAERQWLIRRAAPEDLPGLVKLEQACFTVPWTEVSLQHDLAENTAARYLVAEGPDGSLDGYAAFWIVLDEGQITNIAVAPQWRRRGLGRQLLQAIGRLAAEEKLKELFLEVRTGNRAARSLYESQGFLPVGIRRGYYADNGEDAIIMLKNI